MAHTRVMSAGFEDGGVRARNHMTKPYLNLPNADRGRRLVSREKGTEEEEAEEEEKEELVIPGGES